MPEKSARGEEVQLSGSLGANPAACFVTVLADPPACWELLVLGRLLLGVTNTFAQV